MVARSSANGGGGGSGWIRGESGHLQVRLAAPGPWLCMAAVSVPCSAQGLIARSWPWGVEVCGLAHICWDVSWKEQSIGIESRACVSFSGCCKSGI